MDAMKKEGSIDSFRSEESAATSSKKSKGRKSGEGTPGQRFQCPRCPKSFSRIENLTRHQANHDDVGKFACVVCRKRFTRSDLLNRHRRIHENQAKSSSSVGTPNEYTQSPQQTPARELLIDSTTYHEPTSVPTQQAKVVSRNVQYNDGWGVPLRNGDLPMVPKSHAPNQALTSLMEAALAPQQDLPFAPLQNFDHSLWGGFMMFSDNANAYMGSYGADISWTLESFSSESPPDNYVDRCATQNGNANFAVDPYRYQAVSYRSDSVSHLDAADAEDEDTNDWPDKEGNLDSRQQLASRVVPLHLLPVSWQSILDEARASGLSPTTIHPYQHINLSLRSTLIAALQGANFKNKLSKMEITDSMFPPAEALDLFLRLYIRYVHPRFPMLHLPTFDIYSTPPLLLIVMMFLGSSHSRTDRGRFSRLFYDHLRLAVLRNTEMDSRALRNTENIMTTFLLCLAGTWSGSKQAYEFAEGGRGPLITACRRARLLDCRPSSNMPFEDFQRPGSSQLDAIWLAWVETEKRKRLGLCVYIFDCMYPALFNNQPYVGKAETTNCVFPCGDEFWIAPTAESWKSLVGSANEPPATYYLHALNACLLRKWETPPPPVPNVNSELGKLVLIYAIHTHIFEWRQATSMLNPTGLGGFLKGQALPLGRGLKERRRWLADGVESWAECYQGPESSTAAALLYRLAFVALDVSLSDMHLVAGRSNNVNDGNFAEHNLMHWANSEMATSTMHHVFSMLEIAHMSINNGFVVDSSYEVAVCLFTGGIVCWAYAKLNRGEEAAHHRARHEVEKASTALMQMGCWRMCSMFARILRSFEVQQGVS